ncbi:hypothetical protein R3P38DRAFT_3576271 [Favolaschia claudopus]|uniref:Uncharacterized protein n=1 Tax=Favolaschia claudopus TaxID=2862362 RepID=A0AAW0ALC8_9AGAR
MAADDFDDLQMIRDTISDVPQGMCCSNLSERLLTLLPLSTPATQGTKPATKKRKPRTGNTSQTAPRAKKPRNETQTKSAANSGVIDAVDDNEEDDIDSDPPVSIAVFIAIPKNPEPTVKGRRNAKTEDSTIKKGPFTLSSRDSYTEFLSKIASTLPCLPEHIIQPKMMWKAIKPQNFIPLPIGTLDGYQVMIENMVERKSDRMVLLMMPAPAKPMEDEMPWQTGEEEEEKPARFNYDELEPTGSAFSVQQQQISFNKATKTERTKLEETYPIGNFPAIDPNKRIWHDTDRGFYFDLNNSRLGVWASAMAQKKTDEKTPPHSQFFDASNRMKKVGASNATAIPPPAAIAPPIPPPVAAVPPPAMTPSLSDSSQFRTSSPTRASTASCTTTFLEIFCDTYNIDAEDCARLKEVGFRPGDSTGPNLDDDLKGVGFTFFGWKRIHSANSRFKSDLSAGFFDA